MAKSNWFKKTGRADGNDVIEQNIRGKTKSKVPDKLMGRNNNLKVRTVIFVEQTKGGELAKRTRDRLSRLQEMMGFKMKVAERGGTTLKELFPLNNLWDGAKCEREDCPPCNQGTEEQLNCFKRNLVYESICLLCNPGAGSKGLLKEQNTEVPSIYVGETSRSLYERSREHWDLFEKGSTDSHIWKHHWLHHQGAGRPKMIFKVVKYYRTALSRQVGEAIQIRARGGEGEILNSKGEFNRCSITRLILDKEEQRLRLMMRSRQELLGKMGSKAS